MEYKIYCWWERLSEAEKFTVALTILGILYTAARMFLSRLYARVLVDLDGMVAKMNYEWSQKSVIIKPTPREAAVPRLAKLKWNRPEWLIWHSLQWEQRKKKGKSD